MLSVPHIVLIKTERLLQSIISFSSKGKADTIIKLLTGVKNEPAFPQTLLKNCDMDCGNYPINDGGLPDGVRPDAAIKRNVSHLILCSNIGTCKQKRSGFRV